MLLSPSYYCLPTRYHPHPIYPSWSTLVVFLRSRVTALIRAAHGFAKGTFIKEARLMKEAPPPKITKTPPNKDPPLTKTPPPRTKLGGTKGSALR
jgi:hypothetical protein